METGTVIQFDLSYLQGLLLITSLSLIKKCVMGLNIVCSKNVYFALM
ncbi:MAG: hypothetical protein P857_368 [Candidatus Xenolissoclinum pacificiensis L6]|uniref:Uncharacterized protein n=1 Tax=Candidatus Xenolissoclinum pacificiensis L6 TaxID=1401685 RepID=W2V1X5_9RICK|nr:MAG: hypothetical protein P857_368 [Candidatus Xenolissoclinum pacificiensis L6]